MDFKEEIFNMVETIILQKDELTKLGVEFNKLGIERRKLRDNNDIVKANKLHKELIMPIYERIETVKSEIEDKENEIKNRIEQEKQQKVKILKDKENEMYKLSMERRNLRDSNDIVGANQLHEEKISPLYMEIEALRKEVEEIENLDIEKIEADIKEEIASGKRIINSKKDKSKDNEVEEEPKSNSYSNDDSISPELKKEIKEIMDDKRKNEANDSKKEMIDTQIKTVASDQEFKTPSIMYKYTDPNTNKENGPQSYEIKKFRSKLKALKKEGINDIVDPKDTIYLTKEALKKVDPFLIEYLSYRKDEKTRVNIIKALNEGKDLSEFRDFISYDMENVSKYGFLAKLTYRKITLRALKNGLHVENADKAMMWFDRLLGKTQARFANKEPQKALPDGSESEKKDETLKDRVKVDPKDLKNPDKTAEIPSKDVDKEKDGTEPADE